MTATKDKYSLCMVPTGKTYTILKSVIDELALSHNSPKFVPHVTLIGHLSAAPSEYKDMLTNIRKLASKIQSFKITLDRYEYKDEMYRCLYLLAHAPQLDNVFETAAKTFPRVKEEHFQPMPHLSVLYGYYPPADKEKIIATHMLPIMNFEVSELRLFLTNGTAETWEDVETFRLAS